MPIKVILFAFFSIISSLLWAEEETTQPVTEQSATAVEHVQKLEAAVESALAAREAQSNTPIFAEKALVERYVLDELKVLRHDLQDLERSLTVQITDRELDVADKSLSYAEQTVNFFFYVIAGVASLVALFGWKSLHEIRVNTTKKANAEIKMIAQSYEEKFKTLEKDLRRKTLRIADNHIEIEKINEIHNLWLRAQKGQTPEQKMAAYDAILKIRPGDLEALTSKADAAMELKEFHWALSICNRVLDMDDTNQDAFYQRACAYACLGVEDQAISDLEKAIEGRSALRELAADESDFENLQGNEAFDALLTSSDS
ncbi:tetratricopeptide repeat protein [Psychromonas sp. KJ10-2]|uniref:tetratricopeptide repeat protein n=1 Tax=Psychromonas sp. KJ10-2 TaxID=3391822 RepID=UPI0039B36FD5